MSGFYKIAIFTDPVYNTTVSILIAVSGGVFYEDLKLLAKHSGKIVTILWTPGLRSYAGDLTNRTFCESELFHIITTS